MTEPAIRRRGPGSHADERHPTRHQLLDAAFQLAEEQGRGLKDLSVAAVTRRAGVAKGTFYVHFTDRAAFLVALHHRFHEELLARVGAAVEEMEPGAEWMRTATTAYLDGCLEAKGVKAVLHGARSESAVLEAVAERNVQATALGAACYRALRVPHPETSARLLTAMVIELAILELERGAADPAAREALWRMAGLDPAAGCRPYEA
ncbi:TetR/AcrR family transcriptional regulator [Streptomyces sp. A3M-1-3]|uniref:TetR/AcrR family transcriptional regulator n=1 Tax=Streptomyces sp. A3M-1-3 TaxID=2962044 RepID=UPI0020B76F8E|nr:TetR/AcrR family transcriptional regulator [Streptomyces sp. A3M-1-3]MCP3818467.1 TetR/AcrR family transcriptional regulator [Streptomyces sp. A3M-1-3]